jgi:virginiamycin A acetyltransferase
MIFKKQNRNILISNKARLEKNILLHCGGKGKISIGDYTSINGPNTDIMCHINDIKIGKFNSIARGVSIQEYNHKSKTLSTARLNKLLSNNNELDYSSNGDIIIENDIWIGMKSTILSGVKISNGAIIAANSLVLDNVPPYAIVGGVPARILKFRFNHNIICELQELKWWDLDLLTLKKMIEYFKQDASLETINKFKNEIKKVI